MAGELSFASVLLLALMSNLVKSKLLIYLRTSCPVEDIWIRHLLKLILYLFQLQVLSGAHGACGMGGPTGLTAR